MPNSTPGWSDEKVEWVVGRLLQVGVTIAALTVLAGGIVYLSRHGSEHADYQVFRADPDSLRSLTGIVAEVGKMHGRGVIQLGLVLLIATPVARVGLTAFAFLRRRDYIYVFVTLFVLSVLIYSLMSGYLHG